MLKVFEMGFESYDDVRKSRWCDVMKQRKEHKSERKVLDPRGKVSSSMCQTIVSEKRCRNVSQDIR